MARSTEIRLGQLLIQKRWCSLLQINQGLEVQKKLREEGKYQALGLILIRQGFLDEEKLKMALSVLGSLRLACPSCSMEVPVGSYIPESHYRCPKCQVELALQDPSAPAQPAAAGAFLNKPADPVVAAAGAADSAPAGPGPGASAPEDPVLGRVIGGCRILDRIATGGMGVVYKAKQLNLGRTVAVKVLSEEFSKDRNYVHRFLQEARSAAELDHGNIVHIIDVGEINGLFYIIMEYVDGSNLREILEARQVLNPERVLEIALQASHALKHAHHRGIIHRDIKPENIMITREGVVKIADLGLAKKIMPGQQDGGITNHGAILGTPYYMAPEQIKDFRQVDCRSDVYSLGVTIFRALTGRVPFEGRSPVEVMIKVVEGKRPSIRSLRPDIPDELDRLVDRMMDRMPANRIQDFGEVIQEMDSILLLLKEKRRPTANAVASAEKI
ncbi:MAG: serine/threonine protein kinase [Planctomycetes bacterium]|nr:serine/threonine protein kinase [Planctomycetota bacterium]